MFNWFVHSQLSACIELYLCRTELYKLLIKNSINQIMAVIFLISHITHCLNFSMQSLLYMCFLGLGKSRRYLVFVEFGKRLKTNNSSPMGSTIGV